MSATTRDRDEEVPPGEDTPLLPSESTLQKRPTPVPWAQVWILLVLQLAEPLTSQVIYPFTPEVCRFLELVLFLLIHPLQFVRNVGITHGDESRVGYYVGMMVCSRVDTSTTSQIALYSNLCSSPLRLLQCYTGAGSPTSSVVSQSSSLGCSAYRCQCSALGSQLLIGVPLFGT
jgi:hypothetical protein